MADKTPAGAPGPTDPGVIAPDPAALEALTDGATARTVAAYLSKRTGSTVTDKALRRHVRDHAARIIGREWPERRTAQVYKRATAARVVASWLAGATSADLL